MNKMYATSSRIIVLIDTNKTNLHSQIQLKIGNTMLYEFFLYIFFNLPHRQQQILKERKQNKNTHKVVHKHPNLTFSIQIGRLFARDTLTSRMNKQT